MIADSSNYVHLNPFTKRVFDAYPHAQEVLHDKTGGRGPDNAYWFIECPSGQDGHLIRANVNFETAQFDVWCKGSEREWDSETDRTTIIPCPEISTIRYRLGTAGLSDMLYLQTLKKSEADFVIPGVLASGDRLILTGEEGHGKTTLSRQIALQVACGIHPFTLERMEPRRVLYVDREVGPNYTLTEFGKMIEQSQVKAPDAEYLNIWSSTEYLDLADTASADELFARAEYVDLVVIGPLYKLSLEDQADDGTAKSVINVLDRLRSNGPALFIEAHQPHSGPGGRVKRVIGSSLFLRWPEFGLHLSKNGKLTHWRASRVPDREWPEALAGGRDTPNVSIGGAPVWPWMVGADDRKPWEKLGISKTTYYRNRSNAVDDAE